MKTVILFDLGQTLAHYYDRADIPHVLKECISNVQSFLQDEGVPTVSDENLWQRVHDENREAIDYLVRPLEDRLARIFDLTSKPSSDTILNQVCLRFMKPIFARGRLYEDAVPTLSKLKASNYTTGLISNTPWGSPSGLWREELERLGITTYLDNVVFCRDVGWRKPAPHIFTYALNQLQVEPEQCLFVGDNPLWDIQGPQQVGIQAVLLDRAGNHAGEPQTIKSLSELPQQIEHS